MISGLGAKRRKEGKAFLEKTVRMAILLCLLGSAPAFSAAVSGMPAFYDCRDEGKAPLIRTQGRFGTCWAISAASALEAALLPEKHLVFSPDHMSMNNGFVITQDEGGDPRMIMAYLSGWYGPVLESEDPYGDGETADGLQAAVHVQEMRLLEGMTRDEIKERILLDGPVQTSLRMDRRMTAAADHYYNPETFAFCDPVSEKVTHDILILGWDDTFSRDHFRLLLPEDGAWICQNTWGSSFGDEGIFYVSYADANIARTGLSYPRVEANNNYDRIYQTDVCGWQGRLGYDSETAWLANLYRAQDDEQIMAAGFYSLGKKTSYEIWISHDAAGSSSFSGRELIGEGSVDGVGYFTVQPEVPEPVSKGETFALILKVQSEGIGKPVAVEMEKDAYTAAVDLSGKDGYVSGDGIVWDHAESIYGANVCLKAYTGIRGGEEE